MPSSTMLSRAAFLTFVSLLACLTSSTVICFSMAILDDAFVYAGIACLAAVVLLIGTYTGCRYLCRTNTCVEYLSGGHADESADESVELGISQDQFRRLEREIEDLFAEAGELQLNALCGGEILERQYENLRRDYDQLTQWIEGRKTPEVGEVRDLVQRLDNIRNSLRTIRRRSDRITWALRTRRHSSVAVLSRSVDHHPLPPPHHPPRRLPLQPPPYDDTGRQQQQRHLSTERRQNPSPPATIGITYLPSYSVGRRASLSPPADDFEAPPPYEEANTGHPV